MSQMTFDEKWGCHYEAIIACADEPRLDGIILTERACLDVAQQCPSKFRYDPVTKKLMIAIGPGNYFVTKD